MNAHLDFGLGAPIAGGAKNRSGDGETAAGAALWLALDFQIAAPFALEIVGGGGGFGTPFRTSSLTGAPYGTLGLGGRFRFLDDKEGYANERHGNLAGNLWASAHAGFVYFDRRQFGIDAAVGYELSVVRPLSLGVFARTVIAPAGRQDGVDALLLFGVNASLAVSRARIAVDSDGDGLSDEVEMRLGTDPRLRDTDGDLLSDGLEEETGTNPLSSDTDSDGIPDGREDRNRNGIVDEGETDPRNPDSDGGGITDWDESRLRGTNPTVRSDDDVDGDGVPNPVDECDDTPIGAHVGPEGCPTVAENAPLPGVRFAEGRSRLLDGADDGLRMALRFVRSERGANFEVAAYMEDTGDPSTEARLTQSRAEIVKNWLVRHGIPRSRLVARGYGAADPVAANDTPENRARNERFVLRRIAE
ncbi:MAG: OmpA family protein [Polyangiaceae bacterium]|nr:OmpA family protein [Polyangiaceae bacterium]